MTEENKGAAAPATEAPKAEMPELRLPYENEYSCVGRLTRDPELRFTANTKAVLHLDIAVNRRFLNQSTGEWKDQVTFVPVVAWNGLAEKNATRLKKGYPVRIVGELRTKTWETKEGQKRSALEVTARMIQPLVKLPKAPEAVEAEEIPGEQEEGAPTEE